MKKTKKRRTESVWQTFHRFLGYMLEFLVWIYMLIILVVLPFYNEEGFMHIGTDKAMLFRAVIVRGSRVVLPLLLCFLILKLILFLEKSTGKKSLLPALKNYFQKEMSRTDYFVLLYAASVLISYFFSDYKATALWGTSGWYMGMIPQLTLVVAYFLISRVWKRRNWIMLLSLPASAIVFMLGYLNRFGIFPIDMKAVDSAFISTIGNINWYCGYLVSVFFGGFFLLWCKEWRKQWQKLLLMCYVFIGFATLVTQGSASGLVAMAVILLLTFVLSASEGKRMEAFWLEMCVFSLACIVTYCLRHFKILTITYADVTTSLFTTGIIPVVMTVVSFIGYAGVKISNHKACYSRKFFETFVWLTCAGVMGVVAGYFLLTWANTLSNGAILAATPLANSQWFTFTDKWGSNRGATWMAGIRCFEEQGIWKKIVGVGPDCMWDYLLNGGSPELWELVNLNFGGNRLTNAHNEWLTTLVNMGLLGFISYAGIMISAIKRYISAHKYNIAAGACGFCLLAYTVNNMFSFQQTVNVSTIFIILAAGENYLRSGEKMEKPEK